MESCSSFILPRLVGHGNATYLLSTGSRFPANHSCLSGIFAELLPEPSQVLPRALEIAEDIVQNVSSVAAYLNRQLIWRGGVTAEEATLIEGPLLMDLFGSR
jgi:enoyl-CoA hydratase/carnithine racemase